MPANIFSYYAAALAFGGVFLVLSLLSGGDNNHDAADGHDSDTPDDVDHPDTDGGDEAVHEHHGHAPIAGDGLLWFPLVSMRFWVFATTFCGLTGVLLGLFTTWQPASVLTTALGMGYAMGVAAVNILRAARRGDISSAMTTSEMVGLAGEVILPITVGEPGKIRVQTKSGTEELQALAIEGSPELTVHSRVVITGFRQHRAVVRAA